MYETRPVLVEEITETTPTYPSTLTVPPVPSSFDPHGGNTKCHEVAEAVAPNFTYSLDVPWFDTKTIFGNPTLLIYRLRMRITHLRPRLVRK